MQRQVLEKRILEIINYIGNSTLEVMGSQILDLFSDDELQVLLGFLESGQTQPLIHFIIKKKKEYLFEVQNIKQLKGEVRRFSIKKEEVHSKKEDQKELELLLDF